MGFTSSTWDANTGESVANLVYMASSMSASATERGSASNNNSNDVWIKVSWILFITDSVVFFYKVVNYSLVEYLMTEKCKSNSEHWSQRSNGPSSCHWVKISFAVNLEAVIFFSLKCSLSLEVSFSSVQWREMRVSED